MSAPVKPPSLRRRTRLLGWGGALLLLLIGVAVAGWWYGRSVGVPRFIMAVLERKLAAHGVTARFGRVRLDGLNFQAERVELGFMRAPGSTAILDHATVRLKGEPLKKGHVELDRILIDGGRLGWTFASSNAEPRQISVEGFAADLRCLTDRWDLVGFRGRLAGAELHATASITNASALRHWRMPRPVETPPEWPARIDRLLRRVEGLVFATGSRLDVQLRGDGRDPSSFELELRGQSAQAMWSGGHLDDLELKATARQSVQAGLSTLRIEGSFEQCRTPELHLRRFKCDAAVLGSLTNQAFTQLDGRASLDQLQADGIKGENLNLSVHTVPSERVHLPLRTGLVLTAARLQTPWGESAANQSTLDILHSASRAGPWRAQWEVSSGLARSPWGQVSVVRASGELAPRPPGQAITPEVGFWGRLQPYRLSWEGQVCDIIAPNLQVDSATFRGQWAAPHLRLDDLQLALCGGQIQASGSLDVTTREARVQSTLDFDVRQVLPFLTPEGQRWLRQVAWETPPKVSASVRVRLPEWTHSHPEWLSEVMPTLEVDGEFTGSQGAFREVPIAYASARFALTNLVWHLPDVYVRQAGGEATVACTGDMRTGQYGCKVAARLDPKAVEPLFSGEAAKRTLQLFQFTGAPEFEGEIRGRWQDLESAGVSGRLFATNFVFRGEPCSELSAMLRFTNAVLEFTDVTVAQGAQRIRVPSGRFDLTERVVFVTNAISTMDPDLVTRVIGPKVRAAVRPYHFAVPPTVRVNGRLPTVDTQDADVRFEVVGESFSYWKFACPSVMGDVSWRGDSLSITNVQASFYGGELQWEGHFDFAVPVGAQFRFNGAVRRTDLHLFMADVGRKTNQLEGSLTATFAITDANSDDWRSWQGFGKVKLRDGFLWDIPIFGFFSPVLNTVAPGLGNIPVSAGEATFQIDQSVVHTSDLELKSPALRLRYNGTVDFHGVVDARVQAEILRDAWGVGRAVSFMLWPISKAFEYRITGTVDHPKHQPIYIPKPLLWPLHPFRSFQRFFVPDRKQAPEPPLENPFIPPLE